jgi:hypothetical protein
MTTPASDATSQPTGLLILAELQKHTALLEEIAESLAAIRQVDFEQLHEKMEEVFLCRNKPQ